MLNSFVKLGKNYIGVLKMTALMYEYLKSVEEVEGIWAEFGVYKGKTFKQLVAQGNKVWKYVIGVDSFEGMAKPTDKDGGKYPKGYLNAGGCWKLRKELEELAFDEGDDFDIYEGFVPEVFSQLNPYRKYSFCYIDLDHYLPTKQAIDYIWSKLNSGGLILFDDYVTRYDILATLAIKEFLKSSKDYIIEEQGIQLISGGCKSQLLVRKK